MGFCFIKFHQIHADLSYFPSFYFSDFDEIIVAIRASPVFRPGQSFNFFIDFNYKFTAFVRKTPDATTPSGGAKAHMVEL